MLDVVYVLVSDKYSADEITRHGRKCLGKWHVPRNNFPYSLYALKGSNFDKDEVWYDARNVVLTASSATLRVQRSDRLDELAIAASLDATIVS